MPSSSCWGLCRCRARCRTSRRPRAPGGIAPFQGKRSRGCNAWWSRRLSSRLEIPVGTVAEARDFIVPQAIGNDVCCGMRLLVTDITHDELSRTSTRLPGPLRPRSFGAGAICRCRRANARPCCAKVCGACTRRRVTTPAPACGAWYDARQQEADPTRVHFQGILPAQGVFAFDDYIQGLRRCRMGAIRRSARSAAAITSSELQVVRRAFGSTAHDWGLRRGAITIMAHSGSVGLGHAVGGFFSDQARAIFPNRLPRPEHGFWPLPTRGPHAALAARYLDAMHATPPTSAFGNRLFLGLMVLVPSSAG